MSLLVLLIYAPDPAPMKARHIINPANPRTNKSDTAIVFRRFFINPFLFRIFDNFIAAHVVANRHVELG